MGRVGSCSVNPVAASWIRTLKTEIGKRIWDTSEQVRADVCSLLQRYNRFRRHSSIGYQTPEDADHLNR